VRLSLTVTNFSWPGGPARLAGELSGIVAHAEEGGLDTVWVSDHLLQGEPGTDPTQEMLEAYTTLGYLAAATDRIRLGTLVTANTFREPALLIKAVTTLDVLSGGRAWLGIGAGYHQAEADMMGLPLPPVVERFDRLEDTLQLAHRMWAGDDNAFTGHHHRLTRPITSPAPLSTPHPPILVGGTGEQRTLRLVARYADACNLFDIPDGGQTIRRKLEVLARHCTAVDRPVEEIETTVSTRLGPDESPEEFTARCATLAEYGIDHVITLTAGPWAGDAVARLVRAAPALHALGTPDRRTTA
jgi:F420-dependent oxidoreductase-like protein